MRTVRAFTLPGCANPMNPKTQVQILASCRAAHPSAVGMQSTSAAGYPALAIRVMEIHVNSVS